MAHPFSGRGTRSWLRGAKKPQGGRAADLCDGIRALIAVAEGMLHAQNGRHFDGKPADARQKILHLLALESERGFVGHVLADAAAAAFIDRAERLGAVRAFFQQFFYAAKSVALFPA